MYIIKNDRWHKRAIFADEFAIVKMNLEHVNLKDHFDVYSVAIKDRKHNQLLATDNVIVTDKNISAYETDDAYPHYPSRFIGMATEEHRVYVESRALAMVKRFVSSHHLYCN